jgi:hypothetical protein
MVRRCVAIFVALAATMLFTMVGASAASPHFKHGGQPTCTITGSGSSQTVVCGASLAGLGNGDLQVNVTVSGFAVYQCQNQGGNLAPGQNKVLEGPQTVPTTIPSAQIKNGTVTFTTNPNTLTAAPTVSGAEAGCPNSNWTGVNPTLTITSITMTISQGGQTLFTCMSASDPDGLSGTVTLTC